jgi:hypothetical protein
MLSRRPIVLCPPYKASHVMVSHDRKFVGVDASTSTELILIQYHLIWVLPGMLSLAAKVLI